MRNDSSLEGFIGGVIITLVVTVPWVRISAPDNVNAAINDNGCASYQPPAPGKKTNIEAYNLDSLRSDG
jgi:hypothetical protein